MEGLIGAAVALALSLGFTEIKMRRHIEEYDDLVERVDSMEQNLGRNMIAAMMPMTKSIKELQDFTGMK